LILFPFSSSSVDDSEESLSFITLGDWGLPSPQQTDVAKQMGTSSLQYHAQFIANVGDNFYEMGVDSVSDRQWQTTFKDQYTYPGLDIPWLSTLGNHDYRANPEAQIQYTGDTRWIMPNHYFTKRFNVDKQGKVVLQLVFIDSMWFAPNDMLNQFSVPDSERKFKEQMDWFEATLSNSTAQWLIVVGHYPLFSVGKDHGDSKAMQNAMMNLFKVYNVDAYLCGHDHTLQHLSHQRTEHFVSGTGTRLAGGLRDDSETAAEKVLFKELTPGFIVHTVTKSSMKSMFIDTFGKTIHEFTQQAQRFFPEETNAPVLPSQSPTSDNLGTSSIALKVGISIVIASVVGFLIYKRYRANQRRYAFERTQLDEFEKDSDSDSKL
jgi:hypothetical protein